MTNIRHEHRQLEVACTLEQAEAGARAEEWERLRSEYGLLAEEIPAGARLWLRVEARPAAEDLIRREAGCCGFLDLEVVEEGGRVRLDVTSPAAEARPVIACLAGLEDSCSPPCC